MSGNANNKNYKYYKKRHNSHQNNNKKTSDLHDVIDNKETAKIDVDINDNQEIISEKIEENDVSQGNSESSKTDNILNTSSNNKKNSNIKNNYVSYERRLIRIATTLIVFFIAFVTSGVLVVKYFSNNKDVFSENSSSAYSVCLMENEYYEEKCLGEDRQYLASIVDNVSYVFAYNALYQEVTNKKFNYKVDADIKIFSEDNEQQVLYEKQENLLKEKIQEFNSNVVTLSDSLVIPFREYNTLVNNYNTKYGVLTNAEVDINFFVNDKKVSSIIIPLGEQTFSIAKNDTSNRETTDKTFLESITPILVVYILACVVSLIIVIIFVVKLIKFLLKYSMKSNSLTKYNNELNSILKNYDRIIVEVSNIDQILDGKKIIEIDDFLELVDARDTLDRPILHVKINSIKDSFYLEDRDKVYVYTMKIDDKD